MLGGEGCGRPREPRRSIPSFYFGSPMLGPEGTTKKAAGTFRALNP